jgi:hypothetical protein
VPDAAAVGRRVALSPADRYSWQQFGQLATTTPTVTAITKITTNISPISHCRRKNLWLRHLNTVVQPVS